MKIPRFHFIFILILCLLFFVGNSSTIPLLGLSFFQWFSKRRNPEQQKPKEEETFLPEITAIVEEPNSIEPIPSESLDSDNQIKEKEAEGLPEPSKIEPMRLSKPEFFPPSSWKKFHSQAEIQKKRESIFTPELKDLVQSVAKSKPKTIAINTKPLAIKKPSKELPFSPIPSLSEMEKQWLDAIYTKSEVSSEGLLDYLKIKIGNIGSRFSLLSLNTQLGSYTNSFSSGLDYSTKSNLIFLFKDPFFLFDSEGFFELNLTDEWRRNVFLAKKFSWEILSQSEILLAYDLNSLGFEGLLIFLLDKREVTLWKAERKKKLQGYMRELIPALHKVAREEWEESEVYGDSLTWQIRSFIHATMGGQRAIFVTRVIWENFISEPENEVKKRKIFQNLSQLLIQHDAILETSANSFLLLSEKDIKTETILQLKTFPFPYDIKFMHYPTDGENYFLYF